MAVTEDAKAWEYRECLGVPLCAMVWGSDRLRPSEWDPNIGSPRLYSFVSIASFCCVYARLALFTKVQHICPAVGLPDLRLFKQRPIRTCYVEWSFIRVHVIGSYFQVIMLCISKGGVQPPPLYFVTRLEFQIPNTVSDNSNKGVSAYITCTPSHSL